MATKGAAREGEELRVGELARRAGLTVRTLHHYDEIGLVSPRRRSEAGYRLYGRDDVDRLLRVLLLRRLGLSLPEVQGCIDAPHGALGTVLRRQLERMREQIAAQQSALGRLEMMTSRIERGERASLDELVETMETCAMFEKYYTPEQLKQIEQRGRDIGPQRIAEVEAEWPRLIEEVKAAMASGTDPASPQVQALMERWRGLLLEFTGGDTAIQQSLNRMHADEPSVRQKTGIDPELMEYVGRAMAAKG